MRTIMFDTQRRFGDRLEAGATRFALACGFQLFMRIVEVTRGAAFDPEIHWTRGWLIEAG